MISETEGAINFKTVVSQDGYSCEVQFNDINDYVLNKNSCNEHSTGLEICTIKF